MHHSTRPSPWSGGWLAAVLATVVALVVGVAGAWLFGPAAADRVESADAAVREASAPATASPGHSLPAPASSPTADPSAIPSVSAPAVAASAPAALPSSAFDTERYSLDQPDSLWVVVNKSRPLVPEDYAPADLVSVANVPFADGGTMRREAAEALSAMHAAASAEGVVFRGSSAYRSHARQGDIYHAYVNDWGVARADRFSARPGFSEHQTGWSADLYDTGTCRLKVCFGDTPAGKWVAAHGAEFGFIIRYPEGKDDVTGYKYEPWHVRYVGTDLALEMRDSSVQTLEEFFALPAAPSY